MKKSIAFWSVSLALLFAGKGMAQAGFSMPKTEKEKRVETRLMDAFTGAEVNAIPYNSGATLSKYTDIAKKRNCLSELQSLSSYPALQASFNAKAKSSDNPVDDLTVDAVLKTAGWGTLVNVENNKQMVYTAEFIPSPVSAWYIKGAKFTFYNDNLKPIANFTLNTSDTTYSISLVPQYSTRFFKSDAQNEFMVQVHSFAGGVSGPESCRDTIYIINESGEILKKIGQASGALLYQVPEPDGIFMENRVSVYEAYYSDLSDTIYTREYKAYDLMNDRPALHTFNTPDNLTSYTVGPIAEYMEIEGVGYYVTAQYEKPFIANEDQENPEVEKNNKYNIFLYDRDFNLVKKITLPLIGIEDNEYSMSNLENFSDYMITKHTFNSDDKFEILYAMSRYDLSCDCEKLQFYLMDEDGEILNEIVEGVGSVVKLQNIPGRDDEYALLMGGGDVVSEIKMIGMPSMKENIAFSAIYQNELLSVNFERVSNINGDYEYVFGLGRGESADNTVYGGIAYYDRTGKMVKRIRIDLGADAVMFQPIISSMTMNPYFYLPDNNQEYLYFFRFQNAGGTVGRGFAIANEEKNLYVWKDNNKDGAFATAGLRADETGKVMKNLYVGFTKDDSTTYTFYKLPLVDVELQGEGTAVSPYIITTPAELDQVRNHLSSYFVLGNDIDMASFTGVEQRGFVGIADFTGHFDGQNHTIKNLLLADKGLFAKLTGSVENLSLKNVFFTSTDKYREAGCLVGYLTGGTLRNCHVEADLNITVDAEMVGGIVGQAIANAIIDQCSFNGDIRVYKGTEVGGIAGKLTTGTTVSNSMVKGNVAAAYSAGGIAGALLNNSAVFNSYSTMDVTAKYMAGGIVGENYSGKIAHTYATGKIKVTENDDIWSQGTGGGIAGWMTIGQFGGYIKYNFALNDMVIASADSARIATAEFYTNSDGLVALDSNYALASMLIGPDEEHLAVVPVSDTNTKLNRMHGQSGTMENFTEELYKKMTWSFGQDFAHPWKMTGKMPRLWYEFNVRGVELPYAALTLLKDSSFTMLATVIPAEATNQGVNWKSSDPRIVSVNNQGVIKAMGAGTATITAATKEGGFTASCEVTVIVPVSQVIFAEKELVIEPQKVVTVSTTVLPEEATNKKVRYYSLNTEILSVSGNMIYGNEVGEAKLVAISEDGYASDTCTVYVRVKITDIYLNETAIALNKEKPSFQLVAEVYPEDADASELVWKSADESVCTVSARGLVSGHQKGSTDVTVSTKDGSVEAICIVTVEEFIDNANESETRAIVDVRFSKDNFVVTAASEIASVRVYDLNGQSLSYTAGIAAEQAWIPAAKYAAGIYFVKVELLNGGSAIVKVVKR